MIESVAVLPDLATTKLWQKYCIRN